MVNFYLNQVIFPRRCRTFERKLVASAWDLPASADIYASAGPKFNAFSGTDDNKYLLPLNIVQQSLPELAGTNAEVLSYLLEARNREYCKAFNYSGRLGVEGLSNMVSSMNPPARTILDAGAMILELSNKEVAGLWLQIWQRHRAPADAAVFFDERDRIMVLYPDRRLEPLAVSPFLENMSNCLAYLDQIHTRGTDLKLPADARAALTLSVGLMKDHVVQAAMRLRQLGTTQSVRFVAGREVDVMIRDHCKKPDHARLDSHDVISWLLEQTCDTIESLQPLYISQGREYCARTQAAIDFPEAATSSEQRLAYLNKVHLEEDHSLENLYMPKSQLKRLATSKGTSKKIAGYLDQLDQDQQQLQNLSKAFQARTFDETEVEQEVEAEIEAEAVRQIQKPPIVEPLTPRGPHADVIHFARTGRIVDRSAGYERMAHVLARSRTARKHEVITNPLEPRLFVTTEFEQAVKKGFHHPDDFLRPVNWVLFCRKNGLALVVAPQEAEHILDLFCCNEKFMTHLLVYAAPVARKMSSFEDHFYSYPALPEDWTMPAQLKLELGLFAGRLYFSSEEHDALCNYLGFELPDRPFDPSKALFPTTPFNFLQEWLGRRRKGQDFSASPMGRLCQSHRVDVEDTAVEDRDKVDAEMPDAEEEMLSEMHTALGKENEGRKDAGQVDGVNMASLTLSEGGDESSEDAVGGEEEFGGKKDEDEDED